MIGIAEKDDGQHDCRLNGAERQLVQNMRHHIGRKAQARPVLALDDRAFAADGLDGVISHSPDRAFELFNQVVVLAKDSRDDCGHPVFSGAPKDACRFFEVDSLEKIVRRINRCDEGGEGLADHYIRKYEAGGAR